MTGFVLLISALALVGGAARWWIGRRPRDSGPARPAPVRQSGGQDQLPESGNGDGQNGLAAFYAYQMAAGKIDRSR